MHVQWLMFLSNTSTKYRQVQSFDLTRVTQQCI
ncbi:rCG41137 [Rattus norvegicus]|uniref:RCG41137 n=1 Tax=Rattus norvegicus TaxID=10116 RepID=A6KIQ8_RAT|nr:rCG41137 [Rattus norvegicus]